MTTDPTPEQLDGWAHDIMAMVAEDIAAHRIPLGIRTFSDLHSYVDANEYLLATPCPWGSDASNQDDECGVRFHNDLSDRVQVLLVATADMLAYNLELACSNPQHGHTDERDPRDRKLDYQIPMTCYHCSLPAHWDETIGWYQHDQLGASCWRMEDDPKASPCKPRTAP